MSSREGTKWPSVPGDGEPELKTGTIEIQTIELIILSEIQPLPFPIDEEGEAAESLRLSTGTWTCADRRCSAISFSGTGLARQCNYFHQQASWRSRLFSHQIHPEGARDYLVPSR
jgi:aspartyl-tRNA synthetase